MADLETPAVPKALRAGLPRYPVPVALIGRLAVDSRARGLRLGERLLVDALARISQASLLVACLGVIVDAKNPAAAAFYVKYGFTPLGTPAPTSYPARMILPMATVREALLEG
jgi:ribosomal protein S18 acetylase RimI-like enzyme